VVGIRFGVVAFTGRLVFFLLLESFFETLDLIDQRLLIGTEGLDYVQQLLDCQLHLGHQITRRGQQLLNLFQYLVDTGRLS